MHVCGVAGSRMAMRADLEQLFREADVDKNNFLTLHELCSAMRRLGYTGDDSVIKVDRR